MNKINKSLTAEAVRLLNVSDVPDLYHRIRRWARLHIKHEPVAPIDRINWPKGILMTGLLHKAEELKNADNSVDRASCVYAVASVQEYLDRWIYGGTPVFYIDDSLAGLALLMLSEIYRHEDDVLSDKYLRAAGFIADFLKGQRTDPEGVIPYRPAHGNDLIFADSSGMVLPFLIRYGVIKRDDDAIDMGLRQIRAVMKYGIDPESGLPCHAYSLIGDEGKVPETVKRIRNTDANGEYPSWCRYAPGWGRALGWIMYGFGMCAEVLDRYGAISPLEIQVQNEIHRHLTTLSGTALEYVRDDGLYGSIINDPSSVPDTSATAMIYYGQTRYGEGADVTNLLPYITSAGEVKGAQGECQGLGVYSDDYGSYPWSVGSVLML